MGETKEDENKIISSSMHINIYTNMVGGRSGSFNKVPFHANCYPRCEILFRAHSPKETNKNVQNMNLNK